MLKYPDYYRHYGVKRALQLVAPTLQDMQRLSLPLDSVLHFLSEGATTGISSDDPLLKDIAVPIFAEHVSELADKRGNPKSSMISQLKIIRDYHRKFRKIRQLHDFDRVRNDHRAIVIENYAILPQLYRYSANLYRPYNKWWNIQATLWARVGTIAAKSQRQQFIECRLPALLPSRTILIKGAGPLTSKTLSLFPDPESLFILELWKWIAGYREGSAIAKLNQNALDHLNLLWLESGKWTVINLGLLEKWRQPTREEVANGAAPNPLGIPAMVLANRFLRMLMFLHEARTQPGQDNPLSEGPELEENAHGEITGTDPAPPIEVQVNVSLDNDEAEETIALVPGAKLDDLPLDQIEDTAENNALIDDIVAKDLEALDHLHLEREREILEEVELEFDPSETGIDTPPLDIPALRDITLAEGVMAKANQMSDMGLLSAAEYRRLQTLSEMYTKLPDPYGQAKDMVTAFNIEPIQLKITAKKLAPHIGGVVDTSMLHSTLAEFDSKYINHVMRKDVGNAVLGIQKAGVAVTGYRVEEHRDAMNHYEAHAVQLTPVRGKPSTVHFRLPKVSENGIFVVNGVKYRLSKQRGDNPIRKVNASTVALTSYYGKVFIQRSEKKIADYAGWLTNQIAARGMDTANLEVTEMMLANVHDATNRVPRIYSTLAKRFRSFAVGEAHLFLDYEVRDSILPKDGPQLKGIEGKRWTLIGTYGDTKVPLVVDDNNVFYKLVEGDYQTVGSMEELLNLDVAKAPREIAEIKVSNKLIPVGIFLAYQLGFDNLLAMLGVEPVRRVQPGEHLRLSADEYAITFEDEKLVFLKNAEKVGLILHGIAAWNEVIVNYPLRNFNKKQIYFNILERMKLGVRYLREMDLMVDMFIDPITKELLEGFKEPTTFVGLVNLACEMLEHDWSLNETDFEASRIRGYERFAGAVYGQLVTAVKMHRARNTAAAPIELHPNAVWTAINQDSSVRLVEESNPVHDLKSQEEVTFAGTGGRSGRSMVGRTRVFDPNDLGIISEATKDSADVAITTYMTANPQISDVRGRTHRYVKGSTGASSLISTSALLAPCADKDDPKRVNFISIQNSSTTFCKSQRASPLRTGYERVMAHRSDDLYAFTAKQDGKVTKVTPRVVEVTYKDGTVKAIEIGRRFGNVAGLTIPHDVEINVKEGDTVKDGDLIAYNKHYFEVDPLDKTQALWKAGVLLTTALLESPETLEDSSVISLRAAKLLETQITKVRDIVVAFDQSIHGLLTPGTRVEADSILCTIEDPITADQRLFDDASLDTLKLLAANTPKAKAAGTIDKIEVFYNGDLDELSPSLQEIAQDSDIQRKRLARELKEAYTSGRVTDALRISGNPLLSGQAVIKVYITTDVPAGIGDKGVFANQMKTIFGRVMTGVNETLSGEALDAVFPYQSFSARIVTSPELIGTTNVLLKLIGQRAAALYRGKV